MKIDKIYFYYVMSLNFQDKYPELFIKLSEKYDS